MLDRAAEPVPEAAKSTLLKASTMIFVSLLDMSTKWSKSSTSEGIYEGVISAR